MRTFESLSLGTHAKVEVSCFKGLSEMMPTQLKETTMRRGHRTLLQVMIADDDKEETENGVGRLMGKHQTLPCRESPDHVDRFPGLFFKPEPPVVLPSMAMTSAGVFANAATQATKQR